MNEQSSELIDEMIRKGESLILEFKSDLKSFRQVGFDPIQQEQMVLSYVDKHGYIKRADVAELCRLTQPQAYHILK